jgi:hypothetical protein
MLLLVDLQSADVRRHPDVAPLLRNGWRVKSAVPRVVESEGAKLLVVLVRNERVARRRLEA